MGPHLPLPKYHQVYLVLREQLYEGRFEARLPSELALMRQFGVARVTVRRALERLAGEGLIERRPGRGTTPRAGGGHGVPPEPARANLSGLLENLVSMGLQTSVRVLSVETLRAPATVAAQLRLAPGDLVQKAVRVRHTREGPLSHITTHVPKALVRFGRRELGRKPILLLMEESGIQVGRATQTISARLADADIARHLEVAVGSALLAVQRLIFDAHERPVQWLQGLYRPDRYQYQMELSRVGSIDAKVWVSRKLAAQFH